MKRFLIILGLVLPLAACSPPESTPSEPNEPVPHLDPGVDSELQPTPDPGHDPSQPPGAENQPGAALDLDVNRFGIDLYHELRETTEGNLVVSPLSVVLALGMVLPGADAEASAELLELLGADDVEAVNRDLGTLSEAIRQRGEQEGVTLTIANRGFVDETLTLDDNYLTTLAEQHGFGLDTVNYDEPETARSDINNWVAEQTNQLIEELMPEGSISEDTRLTLVNAIYLLAEWQDGFDEAQTMERPFFFADGSEARVPTMRATLTLPVIDSPTYRAVELPYKNDELAMLVIAPEDLATFNDHLDADMIDGIVEELNPQLVELSLPKLETRFSSSLKESLQALGVERLFCGGCNALPDIAPPAELAVSDVVHEAYLRVDEKGTEAAAATGAVVSVTSAVMPTLVMRVDRPYVLALRDRETGAILFLARVMDPRS